MISIDSLHAETYALLQKWNCTGILCFSGPHGIGKSFTVAHFCEQRQKRTVDVFHEREKHNVKWESVPLPKSCIGILDAPLMSPGDGGFASLKRLLKNAKIPIVIVLDPSMIRTHAELLKTYKCVHVSHDTFETFKKRANAICNPQSTREVDILNHCVRGARRNMSYVLNTYRYLCLDQKAAMDSTTPYASTIHGNEALYTLLCGKAGAHTAQTLLAACDRDNIDVYYAIARLVDANAHNDTIDVLCTLHAQISDAIAHPYTIFDERERLCNVAKPLIGAQPFDAFEKMLLPPRARTFRDFDERRKRVKRTK